MHIKIPTLVLDHLRVTDYQPLVTTLFDDSDKPLRVVFVDLSKDNIRIENQNYNQKFENGVTLIWIKGS